MSFTGNSKKSTVLAAMLSALSLLSPALASAAAPGPESAPTTPFTTRIRANFEPWDANHDGRITSAEIDSALENRRLSSGAAAALATLKLAENNCKGGQAVTTQLLTEYERQVDGGKKVAIDYDRQYRHCERKLSSAGQELLSAVIEHLNVAHKGRAGDCGIFALATTLNGHNLEDMRKIVSKVGPSTYKIATPGRTPITLNLPSMAEIAVNSVSSKDCYWQDLIGSTCARLKPSTRQSTESLESFFTAGCILELIPRIAEHVTPLRTAHAGRLIDSFASSDQQMAALRLAALLR